MGIAVALLKDFEWKSIEDNINACRFCLADKNFKPATIPPTRPPEPGHTERILLLSEAPPLSGGFWRHDLPDNLRENLVRQLGIPTTSGRHGLESFLDRNFFLLQAIKWPLMKTFNHLGPRQQRSLIEHSVKEHLGPEIDFLKPKSILAMGKAAWLCCRFLSGRWQDKEQIRFERDIGITHSMIVMGDETNWMATYLIIDQNLRLKTRAETISIHLNTFLESVR